MFGKVEFDEMGQVRGVTSEGETAKTKKVVCDPSYLPNKVGKGRRWLNGLHVVVLGVRIGEGIWCCLSGGLFVGLSGL